jgi:hypothetical protein
MTDWRTSSYSTYNGNCVEAAGWRKASRSMNNGNCAEVGSISAVVLVRDTQDRDGTVLTFGAAAWQDFTTRLRT